MYSVLLASLLALLLGFSGTLLTWWGWGWGIVFSLLALVVLWVIGQRLIAARLQPAMGRV